jgi:hypothetical protein
VKKLFLISFFVGLFLIPSFCLSANIWQVEDHFTQADGTPTSFTNFGPGGSFTVTNNQLVCTGVYNEGYDNTPLTRSFRQWAKVHVIQLGQRGESAAEILVRVDFADILFYGALWQNNGTVQIHTGNSTSSTVSDTISAGDWIGIEVKILELILHGECGDGLLIRVIEQYGDHQREHGELEAQLLLLLFTQILTYMLDWLIWETGQRQYMMIFMLTHQLIGHQAM